MSAPWMIVAGDFSPRGGMDRANYYLARYLAAKAERSVSLVAHYIAPELANHPRVTVHKVPRPAGRPLLGEIFLDRMGRRAAAALLASHSEARIIVNGENCLWPAITWVHLVFRRYKCVDAGAPWWFRLKNRATRFHHRHREARALRNSRLLIANSEATRRHLIEDVGVEASRVQSLYLGVDPEQYAPATEAERDRARVQFDVASEVPVFLFVGALGYDANKGFDTLLRALPQVRSAIAGPVTVLAVGSGALTYWRRQAATMGCADSVRFLGHIDCVSTLLAAADVLVSPVHYESYGLNVHEAICRGVPAVVSRSAGVAERYPPELAGLLVNDPDDHDELANRLVSALRDRQKYVPSVRQLGVEWLKHSWDHMAAEMVRLIEERFEDGSGVAHRPSNQLLLQRVTS